jgi:hypothetical protein
MDVDALQAVLTRIERSRAGELDAAVEALHALRNALGDGAAVGVGAAATTDGALALVGEVLPGWRVDLEGHARAPDGRWTCSLRASGARDDDEVIGIGHAPSPALAILGALIRVRMVQAKGYS